jgi:DNA-binding transcriptional regulator/RsmH inhibitor MraZ
LGFWQVFHKCSIRKRGRVTIPLSLKDLFGIKRDLVIAGVLSHFEIWSKDSWEAAAHKLAEPRKKSLLAGIHKFD